MIVKFLATLLVFASLVVGQAHAEDPDASCKPLSDAALASRRADIRSSFSVLKRDLVYSVDGNGRMFLGEPERFGKIAETFKNGLGGTGPRMSSIEGVYNDRRVINFLLQNLRRLSNQSDPITSNLIGKALAMRAATYPLALHFECLVARQKAAAASEKQIKCDDPSSGDCKSITENGESKVVEAIASEPSPKPLPHEPGSKTAP